MNKGLIKKVKFFPLWSDEKEIRWLNEMSESGWHLRAKGYISYWFEEDDTKKYVFGYDFKLETAKDFNDYMHTILDTDWEHVGSFANWHYFRRDKSLGAITLYTDNESKKARLRRLLIFVAFVALINTIFVANNILLMHSFATGYGQIPWYVFLFWGIAIIIVALLLYNAARILIRIRKINKGIRE